jgi:glycosyltransferase involved in cell wall biosynthesis
MTDAPTPPAAPVVFLITGLNRGGAETQIVRLAVALRRRGWPVRVLTLLRPTQFEVDLARGGVPLDTVVMERTARGGAAALAGVVRRLGADRPAAVVSFLFHANLAARLTAGLRGVPVVTSIRNERFGPPWREWAIRLTNGLSQSVVVNARATADRLAGAGVLPASKVRVIPNGIRVPNAPAPPERRAAVRRDLGVADAEFLWLAAGRLEPQKGFADLVRAFDDVRAQQSAARLRVAGRGGEEGNLSRLIRDLGLDTHVGLLGLRSDVPDLLAAADAFVLSSHHEGMPNVVMEALAAGVPTVATKVGAVEDLVEDGRSGFLTPPHDPVRLAETMSRLMGTPAPGRARMGAAGRAHIARSFSVEASVDEWADLLASVVGGAAVQPSKAESAIATSIA